MKLVLSFLCLIGLVSCSAVSGLRYKAQVNFQPAILFQGPSVVVNGKEYSTDYYAKSRDGLNMTVPAQAGVGVIFEEPIQDSYGVSGPKGPGVMAGDYLTFQLTKEGQIVDKRVLRSGEVILFKSGSKKPVYLSRDWNPPQGASQARILKEFKKLLVEHEKGGATRGE